jgi:hypothetical protein
MNKILALPWFCFQFVRSAISSSDQTWFDSPGIDNQLFSLFPSRDRPVAHNCLQTRPRHNRATEGYAAFLSAPTFSSTSRNAASQAGCAGQAGAVTRFRSTQALSIGTSA